MGRLRSGRLHDSAPAGLVATTAVAALAARHGLGLDDGSDRGSGTSRHFDGKGSGCPARSSAFAFWTAGEIRTYFWFVVEK